MKLKNNTHTTFCSSFTFHNQSWIHLLKSEITSHHTKAAVHDPGSTFEKQKGQSKHLSEVKKLRCVNITPLFWGNIIWVRGLFD